MRLNAATDTLDVKSRISDVTVFFNGAQVTRSVNVQLQKKKYFLKIEDLPGDLLPQSIQVRKIDYCKILSVKHQLNYKNSTKEERKQSSFEKEIKAQKLKIKALNNQADVFREEEKLLEDNSLLARKNEGAQITAIREAADFYRARLNEIKREKLKLSVSVDSINEILKDLFRDEGEKESGRSRSYSRLMIAVECEREETAEIKVSYFIRSAGWTPTYDFRVDDISKPLTIVYNANVFQSSGEDWNNVNFRLSVYNPLLQGDKPQLHAFYIGQQVQMSSRQSPSGTGALKGSILEAKTNEAIPFASIAVLKNGQAIAFGVSDINGQYAIKPISPGTYEVKVSCVGYQAQENKNVSISADNVSFLSPRMNKGTELQSAEISDYKVPIIDKGTAVGSSSVTYEDIQAAPVRSVESMSSGVYQLDELNIRGSKSDATAYYLDGTRIRGNEQFVPAQQLIESSDFIRHSLKETVANIEYIIEIPYTIPSDGEDYQIKIKESNVPVQYVYHAVPKLDGDVFLTARISEWSRLNLLDAMTSIYYQGTFIGQSKLNIQQAEDTLDISLGRDRSIVVTREGNKLLNDKKTSGNNFKQTVAWNLVVKNNRNIPVNIVLEDQYPLSDRKSIEVELLNASGASVDQKNGKLEWNITLDAGQKKSFDLQYSIKCPRYLALD